MIVNHKNEGWEIFSHSSHGLLAGKIAHEIREQYRNEHWISTLAAIIEHDDRQLDFNEKNYLTNIGTPRDFMLENRNVREIVKRSKRLLSQAGEKSQYTAALIAHHLQFIYKEMANEKKTIAKFLKQLEQSEKKYIDNLDLSKKEIEAMYQILVFADRCSLILCQDEIPKKNRGLEINNSIDDKTFWINKNESGTIQIDPWIFEKDTFTLEAEYKLIKQSNFNNNKEFEKFLDQSPVKIKRWELNK